MTDHTTAAQAANKEIRAGFELTYAADADDPTCASDLSHFTNGWHACIMSQVRAPVAGEAHQDLAPPKCPITGRPFFMALEHPELGMVPTYGGPYDSYTIPHLGGKPDQPWHERELRVYRYDHDLGGWLTDETEVIPLRIVHEDVLHELEDAAPQASEAVRDALKTCGSKVFKALAAIARAEGPDWVKADDSELIYREPVMDEAVRIRQAYDELSAALSAQPGAQNDA